MKYLKYFQKVWNSIAAAAVLLILLFTDVIIHQEFGNNLALTGIHYKALSRFIIILVLLVVLVPINIYNNRKHLWYWLICSIVTLIIGLGVLNQYYNLLEELTVYDKNNEVRWVIGDKLTFFGQKAVDSLTKLNPRQVISKEIIVNTMGSIEDNWESEGIIKNSKILLSYYCGAISAFSFFIILALQALFCSQNKLT